MKQEIVFDKRDFPVKVSWNRKTSEEHYHSEVEFSVAVRGRGKYFVKDTAYDMFPGAGLMVHGDQVHYGMKVDKEGLLRGVLTFSTSILEGRPVSKKALQELEGRIQFFFDSADISVIEQLLKSMEDEIKRKRRNWREIVFCDLEKFLIMVSRAASEDSGAVKLPDPLVRDVIAHMTERYAENRSIEEMAGEFCVSVSVLRRVFKRETGLGLKEFQARLRINAAKKLLETTSSKVASVSYEVGFDSLSAFNREFRLITGVSPSEYRRRTPGV